MHTPALPRVAALLLAFLAVLAAGVGDAAAQSPRDLSGRWAFTVTTENGTGTSRVVLEQEGARVTGTYSSDRMGTRRLEGTVQGDTLSFRLAPGENSGVILVFTGTLQADGSLVGSADFGGMGSATFQARREDP
jgi:hypothetical protein